MVDGHVAAGVPVVVDMAGVDVEVLISTVVSTGVVVAGVVVGTTCSVSTGYQSNVQYDTLRIIDSGLRFFEKSLTEKGEFKTPDSE